MINKNKEDNGSIKKENGMESLPAVIQLNKSMVIDFCACPVNSTNIPKAIINAAKTEPHPIMLTNPFDNLFPNKPMITNPIRGSKGTNPTNFIILFLVFSFSS